MPDEVQVSLTELCNAMVDDDPEDASDEFSDDEAADQDQDQDMGGENSGAFDMQGLVRCPLST